MTTADRRGTTTVSEKAVRRIAERAATEAVPDPATGTGTGAGAGTGTGTGTGTSTGFGAGIRARASKGSADVHGRRADVRVDVTLPYPAPLPETVRRLQDHVTARTHQLTGLDVTRARVGVTALVPAPVLAQGGVKIGPAEGPAMYGSAADGPATDRPPTDNPPADEPAQAPPTSRTPLRWWSGRRLPTLLLALSALVACGAVAVDLIMVHAAGRSAAVWRTDALHWLTRHGPGEAAVTAGAAAVAVLGLLMVVLALTPGHRGLLTVTTPAPNLWAALDRTAVAALVRDAVGQTQGIGPVKVRVRRRSVSVRAGLAFGDRAHALEEARHLARGALDSCNLRRPPRLRVRVRPGAAWDPSTTTVGDGGAAQRTLTAGADDTALEGVTR
ncbi:DUF6286 domain-containing Asp23/Gls24 family envelope stress response protein [Streptomyces sp. NPDC059517]|uniref:DUF6286 domain-containing Asp23/Gls24 family envelope stress response protein n=1 Tax=Streptomyces sp. NPDC059517 TaxID=3346855 RepID=UPI0036BE1508